MTIISTTAEVARENSRQATGQFGEQAHTAPENTLAVSPAAAAWAEEFRTADAGVHALIPVVERQFRDLIREQKPDATSVTVALNYDTDGDAIVYVEQINGEDVEDSDEHSEAISALLAYGYNHDRLSDMSCEYNESGDTFTFDLSAIEGDAEPVEEFAAASSAAWDPWFDSAKSVPAMADEVGKRLGVDELVFRFTDTDGRRVTLHDADGDEIEETELLGAMNSYVTARLDMTYFPGVQQDDNDEWTFRYRVAG